jgi:CRISPR-associated exonuclease Cas4
VAHWLLLAAALLVAGLGALLWVRSRSLQRRSGLPAGRVVYVDTGAWSRCERSLFSRRHRLTGRPDYLVAAGSAVLPVEVKSGAAPTQPYAAHVLQLAAYCLLVEEEESRAPPYGIVKYRDRAFEVEYTPALRSRLVGILEEMRRDLATRDVERSHDEPARCRACGHGDHCGQRLG